MSRVNKRLFSICSNNTKLRQKIHSLLQRQEEDKENESSTGQFHVRIISSNRPSSSFYLILEPAVSKQIYLHMCSLFLLQSQSSRQNALVGNGNSHRQLPGLTITNASVYEPCIDYCRQGYLSSPSHSILPVSLFLKCNRLIFL